MNNFSLRILFSFLCLPIFLFGQFDTGLAAMKADDFEAAITTFQALTKDKDTKLMAHVYLAQAYMDAKNPKSDTATAWTHCNEANVFYGQMRSKKRWDRPKNFKAYEFKKMYDAAQGYSITKIAESGTLVEVERFLEETPKLKYNLKKQLIDQRNTLLLNDLQAKSFDKVKDFYNSKDKLIYRSPKHKIELEKICLQTYLRDKDKDMAKLKKELPRLSLWQHSEALNNWVAIADKPSISQVEHYLSSEKDTFFFSFARPIVELYNQDIQQFYTYVDQIEKDTTASIVPAADAACVEILKRNKPLDPFERTLRTQTVPLMPLTMDYLRGAYIVDTTAQEIEKFVKLYPTYAKRAELVELLRQIEEIEFMASIEDKIKNIKKYAPSSGAFSSLQNLLAFHIKNKDWAKALTMAGQFESNFGKDSLYLDLMQILNAPIEGLVSQAVGFGLVSTNKSEYTPVLSPDARIIFFCRNDGGWGQNEAVYSTISSNGSDWESPLLVNALSGSSNSAPLCTSDDGTELLVFKSGQISLSKKSKNGWSSPVALNKNVNMGSWQGTATLSSDGQILIFESTVSTDSKKKSSLGEIDIFVSQKDASGDWGPAQNIGSQINTSGNDRSPFLHPDNRTLYFSSDSRGGLGNLDVFMTQRIGDSWFDWTKPINMGKEINTIREDWGYSVSTDGTKAIFSADPLGQGQSDIYLSSIPSKFAPATVSIVSTEVKDDEGKPIDAVVHITDKAGKLIKIAKVDPLTGRLITTLPNGIDYKLVVKPVHGMPSYMTMNLANATSTQQLTKGIKVNDIATLLAKNEAYLFGSLEFDYNSAVIKESSFDELNDLYQSALEHQVTIEIQGHTDDYGSANYNLELSQQRANAVKTYFVQKGMAIERVSSTGFGETKPIATNDVESGRQLNRRVEILFKKASTE